MNPGTTPSNESDRTLKDWVLLLRDGWIALAALIVIGVVCGLAAGQLQSVKYESVGTVVVSPTSGFLDPDVADQLPSLTATVERLAGTPAILTPTRRAFIQAADQTSVRRARAARDTEWVADHLRLTQPPDSSIIELTGRADTQVEARDLTRAGVLSLTRVINELRGTDATTGITLRVFSQADDKGKVSPTPGRNLLIGANLGLLLGIPAALALGAMRRRLRRPQDLAALLDAPLLAKVRTGKSAVSDTGLSLARAQMQALGLGERGEIILITGTVSPARIAEIATRLVRAFSETNRRAVLVDADLANRTATTALHMGHVPGLADSLNGQSHASRPHAEMVIPSEGPSPLMVLPAGAVFTEPSVTLSDRRLPGIVAGLRTDYDVIILAGPPLDRQAELVALSPLVDHAVIVTVAGTGARYLEPARLLGRRIFGILLVDRA